VLFAFVALELVSSVLCQGTGWEERLQNDLFCVEWQVKPLKVTCKIDEKVVSTCLLQ